MGMIIVLKYGAVLGSAFPITAVPLSAATTTAATSSSTASTSVFGWCAVLGGLCNPYFLFTLFPLFLFFPPLGGSIIQPTLDKE